MSKSAFTVKAFGIYLLVLGVGLTFAPNLLLSVFGMPATSEVWIRVVGVLVFNIGFASSVLILFGAVDFAGGIWTQLALRAEKARA
jgi:hypothetical protein